MADKVATYSVRVDSNAKDTGNEGAAALEKLRGSISGSLQSIKEYSSALKSLRGSTDEVKAVKEQLKGKIEAERSALSANNLALLKAGTTYEKLAGETRKATAESSKHDAEMKKALGPIGELREKFDALKEKMGSAAGVTALFAVAVLAAVAVVVKLGSALASGAYELGKWIVEAADAARSTNLLREAWTGSATNAAHLGHQLDALAGKVDTPRAKLNELSGALIKALNNSRVSGQGIIDTFNAVAQASAAMGDEVGAKLREIIERAKNTGRVQISLFELQGTGIKREDIAAQLAKTMHVGVAAALAALASGRVKVNDAAAAIRAAVEARFGEINARKLLSLDAQLNRFRENLQKLASGVKIEPLLQGFAELGKLIDTSTVSGDALRQLIEFVGNRIGPAFKSAVPFIKEVFERIELGAYKAVIAVVKVKRSFEDAFKDKRDIVTTAQALEFLKSMIDGVASGAVMMIKAFGTGLILAGRVFYALDAAVAKTKATLGVGWKEIGVSIVDGLTGGLFSKLSGLQSAGDAMASKLKEAFKDALGIKSPSKVFEKYGEQTTEGYKRGVDKGGPAVQGAADGMAPTPPAAAGAPGAPSGAGGRGAPISIVVNIQAGGGGEEAGKKLATPAFLADLTKAIQEALVGAGLPVQAGPPT